MSRKGGDADRVRRSRQIRETWRKGADAAHGDDTVAGDHAKELRRSGALESNDEIRAEAPEDLETIRRADELEREIRRSRRQVAGDAPHEHERDRASSSSHHAGQGHPDANRPLRIGLVSGPMVAIPPPGYAGTERIVAVLVTELARRGHQVTLIGPADSHVDCELVPTIGQALWSSGISGDPTPYIEVTIERAWSVAHRFDVIHSHLDTMSFSFARHSPVPVLHTLHGRLDMPGIPELLDEFRDIPLVAISESQRRWWPHNNWVAMVHHGLPLEDAPFSERAGDYLAFVGRIAPEKGVDAAIQLARSVRLPLRMAAKVHEEDEKRLFAEVVAPAIEEGVVVFEGELGTAARDRLLAGALATVLLGAWPEPFGLVAIESMATGTPVIGRRAGALPEIVDHGLTGFLVDDIHEGRFAVRGVSRLDRAAVRRTVVERFSVSRMVDEYEAVYHQIATRPTPRRAGGRRDGERHAS